MLARLWRDESGQGLPEYALLVAAIVVMVVVVSALFQGQITGLFNDIGEYISDHSGV